MIKTLTEELLTIKRSGESLNPFREKIDLLAKLRSHFRYAPEVRFNVDFENSVNNSDDDAEMPQQVRADIFYEHIMKVH